MKKRVITTILCASMLSMMITACGSNSSRTERDSRKTVSVEKEKDSSKEETKKDSKEETDMPSTEEVPQESTETENSLLEIINKKYNKEDFWREFKITDDGNEIVLGETTLLDLENMGYDCSPGNPERPERSVFKDGEQHFTINSVFKEGATDESDLSVQVVDLIILNKMYDKPDISIGGFTVETTPQDVIDVLGVPDHFGSAKYIENIQNCYEWYYYSEEKSVYMSFIFDLITDEDYFLYITAVGGEQAEKLNEHWGESPNDFFTSGADTFRELYPNIKVVEAD